MKVLYSDLKKLVPRLPVDAHDLSAMFTLTGQMCDSLVDIDVDNKPDSLIGLEVRQNRADLQAVVGLAREAAAYYDLPLNLPAGFGKEINGVGEKLDIRISATPAVRRVRAIKLVNAKNRLSPNWLQEWLTAYGMNSVNLLVDLSNYVMIMTGYTSHLLDADKIDGQLDWRMAKKSDKMKTLDNTEVQLSDAELIISDDKNVLALAGIVGARQAEISEMTTNVICEMALYDRVLIRRNARGLGIATEASARLERELSAMDLPDAFAFLVNLIIKESKAEIASVVFDYHPPEFEAGLIELDINKPSLVAGVKIADDEVIKILKNLRCEVRKTNQGEGTILEVKVPGDRLDLLGAEDLVEEVVRFYGYDKIEIETVPALPITPDLTAPLYYLKDQVRDWLSARSYDEILSQPLVSVEANLAANYFDDAPAVTQNSVNEEFPELRQSMAVGLVGQLNEFQKKNVNLCHSRAGGNLIKIFEIGRVFGQLKKDYVEHESLGILCYSEKATGGLEIFWQEIQSLLTGFGLTDLTFVEAKTKPQLANQASCWQLSADKTDLGIIYKLLPQAIGAAYFAEIDLDKLTNLVKRNKTKAAVELTQKLVSLDVNLTLAPAELQLELQKLKSKIGSKNLFSLAVVDSYKDRYTVRVTYQEMSDQDAKALHGKIFSDQKK